MTEYLIKFGTVGLTYSDFSSCEPVLKWFHTKTFTYLKIVNVTMVIIKPANDIPQPIHVIICSSNEFTADWDTSNRIAKFVKWSHWQKTLVVDSFTKLHPRVDQLPFLFASFRSAEK